MRTSTYRTAPTNCPHSDHHLTIDPQERDPVALPHLHTWVATRLMQFVDRFEARPRVVQLAAATYQLLLDHIEATERVYHAMDPVDRLRAAVAAF